MFIILALNQSDDIGNRNIPMIQLISVYFHKGKSFALYCEVGGFCTYERDVIVPLFSKVSPLASMLVGYSSSSVLALVGVTPGIYVGRICPHFSACISGCFG